LTAASPARPAPDAVTPKPPEELPTMAKLNHFDYAKLITAIKGARGKVADDQVLSEVEQRLTASHGPNAPAPGWKSFSMFWPPRLVKAMGAGECVGFFGAGLSIAAGAPAWGPLLREHLKLSAEYVED